MSYPTILAPWYVVQGIGTGRLFYRTTDEGTDATTADPYTAMVFHSLQAAARVARAMAGEVRVLTSKDELAEFRPKGEL